MTRRIFGLETEYGITYAHPTDDVTLSADEVARQLFKKGCGVGTVLECFSS